MLRKGRSPATSPAHQGLAAKMRAMAATAWGADPKRPSSPLVTRLWQRFSFSDLASLDLSLAPSDELASDLVQANNIVTILPSELIHAILLHLELNELYNAALTCHDFSALVHDDLLWRRFFHSRVSAKGSHLGLVSNWRGYVRQRLAIQDRWRDAKPKRVRTFQNGDTHRVWSISFDKDHIISGSTACTLQIWNRGGDRNPRVLRGHTAEIRSHCGSGPNQLISAGYDMSIKVWDLTTLQCLRTMPNASDIYAVRFNQGKIASCSRDAIVRLWDYETGNCLQELKNHTGCLRTVTFERNLVMSGGEDKSIQVWDARTNACIATLLGHSHGVTTLQFDDRKVLSGSFDTTVRIWDMSMWRTRNTLIPTSHASYANRHFYHAPLSIWDLQFDEEKIVTAHADNCAIVWDVQSGEELSRLKGHTSEVICLQFNTDTLVTGSEDRSIRLWDFSP